MKEYGFSIGDRNIIIGADTEQNALHILIERYWQLIDKEEHILLLGEIVEKHKVNKMPDNFLKNDSDDSFSWGD